MSNCKIKHPKNINEEPDEDVVDQLEEALAMAKSGRIRSIVIAARLTGNSAYTWYSTIDTQEAINLTGYLDHTISARYRERRKD